MLAFECFTVESGVMVRQCQNLNSYHQSSNHSFSWQQSMTSYGRQHAGIIRFRLSALDSGSLMTITNKENSVVPCIVSKSKSLGESIRHTVSSSLCWNVNLASLIKLTLSEALECGRFIVYVTDRPL